MTLSLDQVSVAVDGRALFAPVSLTVAAGETVALMAPSGAGKSSLLLAIAGGLRRPLSSVGTIRLDGRTLDGQPPERRGLGVLFQEPMLFPHMTVWENLAFAVPRWHRAADRRARITQALESAELEGFATRHPRTLSGGQAARVALIRALLAEPRALLLDEPFAKLDAPLRKRFRAFVRARTAAAGLPCLLVTHDLDDARDLGARVAQLTCTSASGQATPRARAASASAAKIPG